MRTGDLNRSHRGSCLRPRSRRPEMSVLGKKDEVPHGFLLASQAPLVVVRRPGRETTRVSDSGAPDVKMTN